MRPLQALVLAVCWVSCTASSDRVSHLTESTYDAFAAAHPLFVVQFYAPWCGHSRALAPEYDAAASMLEALPLAKVDGTEAEALATRLDVKGYPTIFFIRDGIADEYDGERTRDAITRWARAKQSPTLALLESSEALDEYTADARLAPVLFLTKPIDQTSDAYRAMLGVAGAIGVPCAVSTAAPPPEVSAPSLVVFKSYDEPRAVYTGELQRQQMEKFIRSEELPWLVKYSSNVEDSLFSSDAPLHGFYLHGGEELDGTTVDALKGAAKLLRGRVVFAEVDISADATASKELADFFDVKPSGELATPALAAFSLADGTKFVHSGAIETEQIVAFMQSVLSGQAEPYLRSQPVPEQHGAVVELVGSTYASVVQDPTKDVFVQFYSPSCGHCRKLAPVWESLALQLADDADLIVAQIDATRNDVIGIDPEGFPTLLFFPKDKKKGIEYDGSRDDFDLVQFVKNAREGKEHIGGLPDFEESEEEGAKLEL